MNRDPETSIVNGYDIHTVFEPEQKEAALALYHLFLDFLSKQNIPYQHNKVFDVPVGPWPTPMWQVILPSGKRSHLDLGPCIAWLMLNRGAFSVMIHPNTKQENGLGGGYEDHSQNMFWMGAPQTLKLHIFQKSKHTKIKATNPTP